MAKASCSIRAARNSDTAGIATVFALSCAWAYQGILPPVLLANYTPERQLQRWTDRLTSPFPGHEFFVACRSGAVTGFIEIGPATTASGSGNGSGEVHYLFVHPHHLGRGIGGQLLHAGETRLARAGHSTAVLWVFCGNTYARAFYERLGWAATGRENLEPTLAELGYTISECQYGRNLGRPAGRRPEEAAS